jgi:hypothetical protein
MKDLVCLKSYKDTTEEVRIDRSVLFCRSPKIYIFCISRSVVRPGSARDQIPGHTSSSSANSNKKRFRNI